MPVGLDYLPERKVLVANDNTFLLSMLTSLLIKEFDEVVAVTDGQQAVDKALERPVDYFKMIILDINMPRKDGVKACLEITEHFKACEEEKKEGTLFLDKKKKKKAESIYNLPQNRRSHSSSNLEQLNFL